MGLLDQLGAGGALALLPTNQQQLQQFSYYPYPEMLANVYQQQKYPLQVCSHPNCLICAKQTKTAQKLKIDYFFGSLFF